MSWVDFLYGLGLIMNFLPGSFILLAMWLLMFSEILLLSEEFMALRFSIGLGHCLY